MNFNMVTYAEPKNDFKNLQQLHLNENLLDENMKYIDESLSKILSEINFYINKYPTSGNYLVKKSIQDNLEINYENLFIDNGSSNIIRSIFMRYMDMEGSILLPYPSWSFYSKTLDFLEQDYLYYNLEHHSDNSFIYNVDTIEEQILKNNIKMIVICSPNNPTGNVFNIIDLENIVEKYNNIKFIIDQAYYGFENNNEDDRILNLITNRDNIYVIRTMSKFYGLANLRLGFLVSNKDNITSLENLNTVFGSSSISQYIVENRLKNTTLDIKIREEYRVIKEYLLSCNSELNNFVIFKSNANFFLIRINFYRHDIADYFLSNGYVIKIENFFDKYYIRLTISNINIMRDFINKLIALDKYYGI